MATSLGTANLNNQMTFESAPKNIKCMYYAFGNSEGKTPDSIYSTNVKLMSDTVHWDDTSMGVNLAHRYGYKLHPAILEFREVAERFLNSGNKIILFHELSGLPLPSGKGKAYTTKEIKDILSIDAIGLHAIYGEAPLTGPIKWKNYDEIYSGPVGTKRCVVFTKDLAAV